MIGSIRLTLLASAVAVCSSGSFAQSTRAFIWSCDDQISWCDQQGGVVPPPAPALAEQCNRYPGTCKNGQPTELADSGCVDPEGWMNYCTDQGKLRDPTPAEVEHMERCGETIDGVYYQCQ